MYCKNTGKQIESLNYHKIQLTNDKKCDSCNKENESKHSYCSECGKNLSQVYNIENNKDNKNDNLKKDKFNLDKIKSILGLINLKRCVYTVLLSIFIILMSTMIIFNEVPFMNRVGLFLSINGLDVLIGQGNFVSEGYAKIYVSMIFILMIPIISIYISNKLIRKNEIIDIKVNVINSIIIGILYSFVFTVLTRIYTIYVYQYNMINNNGMDIINYFNMDVFIKSMIISTLISILANHKAYYQGAGKSLNIALKIFLVGIISTLIVVIFAINRNTSFIYDLGIMYKESMNVFALGIQMSCYIWAFSNLIPISIVNNDVNIIEIFNSNLFSDTKIILMITLLISLLIFILTGVYIKEKYEAYGIKFIKRVSLFYMILMMLLSIYTYIYIEGGMNYIDIHRNIRLGFDAFIGGVVSFIYSYLLLRLGYKLNNIK